MIIQVVNFFNDFLTALQGLWKWCSETSWTILDVTFTPLSVFSTSLIVFLGVLIVLKIKNLII